MKKYLLATTCIVAFGSGASAADLPVKAAPMVYPVASNWTGGYIGAHLGVARNNASCTGNLDQSYGYYGACSSYYGTSSQVLSDTGVVGGVEIGYDWQNRSFVYGVAADWTWTDLDRTQTGYSGSASFRSKVDWLASFRGRMGLAVEDTLVYITGGLALGQVKGYNTTVGTDNNGEGNYGRISHTGVGWVAGLGVEHKFSRNWSVKAEMLYYDLGRKKSSNGYGSYVYVTEFSNEVLVGRVGVNYRF
jgi:outer membrane immunogenic protein